MKVHHLNCGTIKTPGAPMVCHVLLLETDRGLALIDTGFGLLDCENPRRIGPSRYVLRPALRALRDEAGCGWWDWGLVSGWLWAWDFNDRCVSANYSLIRQESQVGCRC